MFTGLIEEVGRVAAASRHELKIEAPGCAARLRLGDSLAVQGACLTAARIQGDRVWVDVSAETLAKTTLGRLAPGHGVNLETALTLDRPLGGHLLLGHVDCVGRVRALAKAADSWRLTVEYGAGFDHLVVARGSIAVDGVSLTVAELAARAVHIALIPHTIAQTTLAALAPGREVNLEFDVLGKYVARWLEVTGGRDAGGSDGPGGLTMDRLRDLLS
jgi:riboflavin synthase